MKSKQVAAYLNDHLAGSVAALELIEHLIKRYSGQPLESFLVDLYQNIKADQNTLRKLLGNTEQKEGFFRKMAAWIAEKLLRSKFKVGGEEVGGLGLVQALETLVLGIHGKQLLWRALATSDWPGVNDVDLVRLEQRAIDQEKRVEEKRLAAAREAFKDE
jgi:hypothetical protein